MLSSGQSRMYLRNYFQLALSYVYPSLYNLIALLAEVHMTFSAAMQRKRGRCDQPLVLVRSIRSTSHLVDSAALDADLNFNCSVGPVKTVST